MAYLFNLPSLKTERMFVIPEVRTKSSVAKQNIRLEYRKMIEKVSNNFSPLPGKQYAVCLRISCSSKRLNFPDIENISKEIVDTLFPFDDSINVIKGIQMEAEVANIETTQEKTEVYIYTV